MGNLQLAEGNDQLEHTQRQLVHTDKLTAIGGLAQGLAHEMNTPLGVILSNLAVLQEYGLAVAQFARVAQEAASRLQQFEPPAKVAEDLQLAAQSANLSYILGDLPELTAESTASADRLAAIVRSLATLARQRSDTLEAFSVEEALEAAIILSSNELKHCCRLVRHVARLPPVSGQLSDLAQVFVHLLLNATQSLHDRNGEITVTTACDDSEVSVEIGDNGCGIAPEHLSRVFDPLFITPEPGLGAGLAVCRSIVSRFGGSIALESEPGRGTRVTVRLPVAAQHTAKAA